jgi:hypothetical protein
MIIPRHNILNKLSLFQGLEEYKDERYPNSIYYLKYGEIYFELDVEKHILYCSYTLVWNVFSEQSKYNYGETQRVIKGMVERHTNWGSITPFCDYMW